MCIFYGFIFFLQFNCLVVSSLSLYFFSPHRFAIGICLVGSESFQIRQTEWIELGAPRGKIKWISWTQNDKRKPFFCSFLAIFIVMHSLIMLFIARTENCWFVLVDEKNVANQSVWSSDLAEISARHCFEWIFRVTMHRTLFVWVYICASERMSECAFWMWWLSNLREFAFIFIHVCVISVCGCRWYDYLRGERLSSVVWAAYACEWLFVVCNFCLRIWLTKCVFYLHLSHLIGEFLHMFNRVSHCFRWQCRLCVRILAHFRWLLCGYYYWAPKVW